MYSIRCDLHSKRMQLCLVDDDPAHEGYPLPEAAVLLERKVPATRAALAEWVGEPDRVAPGPKALAVETTSNWEWFVDAAGLLVEEVHLVHAQRAKAIASARIKTDKIDARVLARLKTTPGLGQRLSMRAALEIVEIERFPGDRNYVSYCGLAPGTHESDETRHRRGLLPHGNRYLKWIYTQGAGHAKRHAYFRSTWRRQEAKNGKMIARLTVAPLHHVPLSTKR